MCQMKIILKQGAREEVILENAASLDVSDLGVTVSALFEQPHLIPGAEVRSIDFLSGRVTVMKRQGEIGHGSQNNN